MDKEEKFAKDVERIMKINDRLKEKGFDHKDIDKFWAKIFKLMKKMAAEGLTLADVKICTGCGHLNIEKIDPPRPACCPDSRYVPIHNS